MFERDNLIYALEKADGATNSSVSALSELLDVINQSDTE